MRHLILAAGPLVWPLLALAATSLLIALCYAIRPNHHRLLLATRATLTTLLLGLLGTITGIQMSISHIAQSGHPVHWPLVMLGLYESLYNTTAALVAATLVGILLVIGTWRQGTAFEPSVTAGAVTAP